MSDDCENVVVRVHAGVAVDVVDVPSGVEGGVGLEVDVNVGVWVGDRGSDGYGDGVSVWADYVHSEDVVAGEGDWGCVNDGCEVSECIGL